MDMFDPSTWKSLKDSIDLFRNAIGLAKDAKNMLGDGSQKEAIASALHEAEQSAALAEAKIAQSLDYELCRCTFPPQIMLLVGRNSRPDKPVYRCSHCGNQEPSQAKLRQWDESHRSIHEHNQKVRERYRRTFGKG
jgi:hypothetical protein